MMQLQRLAALLLSLGILSSGAIAQSQKTLPYLDPALPTQQRVDDEKVRHGRRRRGHEAKAPAERQDAQVEGQEELEHQSGPERGDRDARD